MAVLVVILGAVGFCVSFGGVMDFIFTPAIRRYMFIAGAILMLASGLINGVCSTGIY